MEETKKPQRVLGEENVLNFWKENNVFEKSLEKASPKGEYVFYEGPPTANGKPGIHHLEARAFKDAVLRYKTMKGYHVTRRGGWDTHGLPVEIEVEKKLNLKSKKEIEEYGIDKFNIECKNDVWKHTDLWQKFTDRIGFWVDQSEPYVTYNNSYMESVWNVIKEASNQDLLYKDYKIVPWCPRCGTGLSSHELAQGYQDVKDLTVYVKFRLNKQVIPSKNDNRNLSILVWTTTPWTLPANVALAVGEDIDYVKIEMNSEFLILAKSRLSIIEGEYKIVEEIKGLDLIGLSYESLFSYPKALLSEEEELKLKNAYKIYGASFVTTEDGTGVVHIAPMYGQDDFDLGNKVELPKCHIVGLDGKFLEGTDFLENKFVRNEDVAVDIIKNLVGRDLLFKKEKHEHTYPHCWRCKTALIYYARDSWYIKMTNLRDKMIKENEDIFWEPSYIKNGRFGEWLRDIKDWAISRERYWGTPLPVWKCLQCGKIEVLGSLDDIKSRTKKSGNKYFVMRHGESENNLINTVNTIETTISHLTHKGKDKTREIAQSLKDKKIDLIISSPITRAKETAIEVSKILDYNESKIETDERLTEMKIPEYEGRTWDEYHEDFPNNESTYYKTKEGCESWSDIKKRSMDFLYDLENKYQDKNILIVTHGGPAWLMTGGILGYGSKETLSMLKGHTFLSNSEYRELEFLPIPHDKNYELDLHRPYIDEITLSCSCGGSLERTKEVMDVWLDSGSMPFAQSHYPFSKKEISYPADFISEGIDQTRGWFYTLHAVGSIMNKGKAFKNVICLGLVLDANGKKMSKSLGNGVDPWGMIDKYGVDTLRLWMYSVNQPGEPKKFDEKTVSELNNKFFNLLYNVIAFYELYRDKEIEKNEKPKSNNILDVWILSKLGELIKITSENMETYKLLEPIRATRTFIDDLSTWYLRRSRDRIKDGDIDARQTLYYVFKTLAKIIAPFAPFAAEDIWQKIKKEGDVLSVHLSDWPETPFYEEKVFEEMNNVREIVTLGLQSRQKLSIPVRQPLQEITIKKLTLEKDYISILKDELNIKNVKFEEGEELEVILDTSITEELKEEGNYRELVRAIQDIRKKNEFTPNDLVSLEIKTDKEGESLINKFKDSLLKSVSAISIEIKENEGQEVKIDQLTFVISVVK